MSYDEETSRIRLDFCKAKVLQIQDEISANDLTWHAFMVGLLIGQIDKWIAHGDEAMALVRLADVERYMDSLRQMVVANVGIRP
jgi:hypothetical protein